MPALPDPERSRVVLVGASRFKKLPPLPAVVANVAELRALFTSEKVWALPAAHCAVVRDPREARTVSRAVREAARVAEDTLVFYYAGHGLIDPGTGELYLALRDSHPEEVYDSAVPYAWIRRALTQSPAARRVVVLDCCYSGRMLGAMSEGLDLAEIDGTYLLAATAENAVALAPPKETHTAFTGELVEVLRNGVPRAEAALTLNQLYGAVRASLRAAGRPEPQCRDRNALGTTPFVPNPGYRPLASAPLATTAAPDAAMRRFVADMSYELRTPLTAITAVTEVLEEEADSLDPMIAPAVQLMVSETRRLNVLVENLMEISRFDAGTAKVVLDDVDIADQVTRCIDERAWMDAVELRAERGIIARADPRRLDVILANIIGNALKHGGAPVTVTLASATAPRPGFRITVSDSGPGIPEDVLPHVFDRFYKASASRPRSEGSGLGLSLALVNARLMGGTIRAANRPQGGAEFVLDLPLEQEPQ
jgi:two-component system, OmpR family, sensor histidine kinase MtrB